MKENNTRPLSDNQADGIDYKTKEINWGEFSTHYSKMAIEFCLDDAKILNISFMADKVHDNWVMAVNQLWTLIDEGYTVKGGYSDEKRASHETLCVKYADLPYEEQLKDCYVIKDILTNNPTRLMHGKKWSDFIYFERYDNDFERYDIGW